MKSYEIPGASQLTSTDAFFPKYMNNILFQIACNILCSGSCTILDPALEQTYMLQGYMCLPQ